MTWSHHPCERTIQLSTFEDLIGFLTKQFLHQLTSLGSGARKGALCRGEGFVGRRVGQEVISKIKGFVSGEAALP